MHPHFTENQRRVIGNERQLRFWHVENDNPSATAHREAVGAVHTNALEGNKWHRRKQSSKKGATMTTHFGKTWG